MSQHTSFSANSSPSPPCSVSISIFLFSSHSLPPSLFTPPRINHHQAPAEPPLASSLVHPRCHLDTTRQASWAFRKSSAFFLIPRPGVFSSQCFRCYCCNYGIVFVALHVIQSPIRKRKKKNYPVLGPDASRAMQCASLPYRETLTSPSFSCPAVAALRMQSHSMQLPRVATV